MKRYITIEECNKKIVAYSIIIAVTSALLAISIIVMTCHANNLRENSIQIIHLWKITKRLNGQP